MFSFTDENRSSLVSFFDAALAVRKEIAAGPVQDMIKWSKDALAQKLLIEQYAPVLLSSHQSFNGVHAIAYLFTNCVVKTNVFGQWDSDGQCKWLNWCILNQHNPLVPKIALLIADVETDRFLVVMEKLVAHSGFQNHEYRREIDVALKTSFEQGLGFFNLAKTVKAIRQNSTMAIAELREDIDLVKEIGDHDCARALEMELVDHEITLSYIDQVEALWRLLTHEAKDAFGQIRQQFRAYSNRGHLIDLHSLNWMLRSNGEQVLLDPVN